MIKYIASYYALQQMSNDEWSGQHRARSALSPLAGQMAHCFRDYLFMACIGEARHSHKMIYQGFEGIAGGERSSTFAKCKQYACSPENVNALAKLFDHENWSGSIGGPRWATLARLVLQYGALSDTLFVDAVINAQHNCGTAFSKKEAMSYMDIDLHGIGDLSFLLDYRRAAGNYLQKLSDYSRYLTLSVGRMALTYASEKHFRLDIGRFYPLAEPNYVPVVWGTSDLPPIVKRQVKCYNCDNYMTYDEAETCDSCSHKLCHKCHAEDGECSECRDRHEHEEEEEAHEDNLCPVCLEKISGHETTTNCGYEIHDYCYDYHRAHCPTCHDLPLIYKVKQHENCAVCHTPLGWSNWHTKTGKQVHMHCYCLLPKEAYDHSEIASSRHALDEKAVLCHICGLPVGKQYCFGAEGNPYHLYCYMHALLIEESVINMYISDKTKSNWRNLFNVTAAQEVQEEPAGTSPAVELACPAEPTPAQPAASVEFTPASEPPASQVASLLATYSG